MIAIFQRKISQPLRSVFVVGFLLLCMLGTHWIGFAHGIAHTGLASPSIVLSPSSQSCDINAAITHSSASCHLFDALTLASFVSPDGLTLSSQPLYTEFTSAPVTATVHQTLITAYRSQAPPQFIL
jgi:hypothetical protein